MIKKQAEKDIQLASIIFIILFFALKVTALQIKAPQYLMYFL
jgi:hypothetical protein